MWIVYDADMFVVAAFAEELEIQAKDWAVAGEDYTVKHEPRAYVGGTDQQ